ncbi:hypothetical protein Plhal304r1_c099g0174511 [Plasmopara halstedii]
MDCKLEEIQLMTESGEKNQEPNAMWNGQPCIYVINGGYESYIAVDMHCNA